MTGLAGETRSQAVLALSMSFACLLNLQVGAAGAAPHQPPRQRPNILVFIPELQYPERLRHGSAVWCWRWWKTFSCTPVPWRASTPKKLEPMRMYIESGASPVPSSR
jgi:hypothetical protein